MDDEDWDDFASFENGADPAGFGQLPANTQAESIGQLMSVSATDFSKSTGSVSVVEDERDSVQPDLPGRTAQPEYNTSVIPESNPDPFDFDDSPAQATPQINMQSSSPALTSAVVDLSTSALTHTQSPSANLDGMEVLSASTSGDAKVSPLTAPNPNPLADAHIDIWDEIDNFPPAAPISVSVTPTITTINVEVEPASTALAGETVVDNVDSAAAQTPIFQEPAGPSTEPPPQSPPSAAVAVADTNSGNGVEVHDAFSAFDAALDLLDSEESAGLSSIAPAQTTEELKLTTELAVCEEMTSATATAPNIAPEALSSPAITTPATPTASASLPVKAPGEAAVPDAFSAFDDLDLSLPPLSPAAPVMEPTQVEAPALVVEAPGLVLEATTQVEDHPLELSVDASTSADADTSAASVSVSEMTAPLTGAAKGSSEEDAQLFPTSQVETMTEIEVEVNAETETQGAASAHAPSSPRVQVVAVLSATTAVGAVVEAEKPTAAASVADITNAPVAPPANEVDAFSAFDDLLPSASASASAEPSVPASAQEVTTTMAAVAEDAPSADPPASVEEATSELSAASPESTHTPITSALPLSANAVVEVVYQQKQEEEEEEEQIPEENSAAALAPAVELLVTPSAAAESASSLIAEDEAAATDVAEAGVLLVAEPASLTQQAPTFTTPGFAVDRNSPAVPCADASAASLASASAAAVAKVDAAGAFDAFSAFDDLLDELPVHPATTITPTTTVASTAAADVAPKETAMDGGALTAAMETDLLPPTQMAGAGATFTIVAVEEDALSEVVVDVSAAAPAETDQYVEAESDGFMSHPPVILETPTMPGVPITSVLTEPESEPQQETVAVTAATSALIAASEVDTDTGAIPAQGISTGGTAITGVDDADDEWDDFESHSPAPSMASSSPFPAAPTAPTAPAVPATAATAQPQEAVAGLQMETGMDSSVDAAAVDSTVEIPTTVPAVGVEDEDEWEDFGSPTTPTPTTATSFAAAPTEASMTAFVEPSSPAVLSAAEPVDVLQQSTSVQADLFATPPPAEGGEDDDDWDDFEGPVTTTATLTAAAPPAAENDTPANAAGAVLDDAFGGPSVDATDNPGATGATGASADADAGAGDDDDDWDAFEGPTTSPHPAAELTAAAPSVAAAGAFATFEAAAVPTQVTFEASFDSTPPAAAAPATLAAAPNGSDFGDEFATSGDDEWDAFESAGAGDVGAGGAGASAGDFGAFSDTAGGAGGSTGFISGAPVTFEASFDAQFDSPAGAASAGGAVVGGVAGGGSAAFNGSFAAFGDDAAFTPAAGNFTDTTTATAAASFQAFGAAPAGRKAVPTVAASTAAAEFYSPATLQALLLAPTTPGQDVSSSDVQFVKSLPHALLSEVCCSVYHYLIYTL